MNVKFAYVGHSTLSQAGHGQVLRLVPNLARDPVAFDAPLLQPLRFREAISALHDCVVSDLRFKKRDKTAYKQWKADQQNRERTVRREALAVATAAIQEKRNQPIDPNLSTKFERLRKRYWEARIRYSDYLQRYDMELWRMLTPCDPVITVADDVCFFECFSGDESSYGCLTVNRGDGFGRADDVKFGTTNVDYSWNLYHHFQSMRSYRETRFRVDPAGFEVATQETPEYREEKIDLPNGWLRGFMQIQAAMTTPGGRVEISREAMYSIMAWMKRHKARSSPRAIRVELLSGKPPKIVLEPWEVEIISHGTRYTGPSVEPIRMWGARRLMMLGRVLPLAEKFELHYLGTGLPGFWIAHMGEMRLTIGLSGWTTNDWTRGSAIDLLAPPAAPSPDVISNVAAALHEKRAMTLKDVCSQLTLEPAAAAAALRELAHSGQLIYDLVAGLYRWRQVMPRALGEAEIGPEHPELAGARDFMQRNQVKLEGRQEAPNRGQVLSGKVGTTPVEIMLDADQRIRRGKCTCSYFHRFALKNGPCRHMLALRWGASVAGLEAFRQSTWYNRMLGRDGAVRNN